MSVQSKPPERPGGVTGRGFQPGQSGNPGGRLKAVKEVEETAREHTAAAMAALAEIATNGDAPPAARVSASSVLLDRGWGKAKQHVEHSGKVGFEDMPSDARQARIAALMAQLGYVKADDGA